MSTARRIQVGILVVVFVVIAACGGVILTSVRQELVARIDDQLVDGSASLGALNDDVSDELLATLEAAGDQPDRASAILVFDRGDTLVLKVSSGLGADGDPLPDVGRYGLARLRANAGKPLSLDAVTGDVEYRAVVTELGDSLLVLATPLDAVRDTMRRVSLVVVVSALGAVLLIALAIRTVTRRAIRPVDEMIEAAVAIGDGNLGHRIETSSRDAEVLRLSSALNEMLHQLEGAFAAQGRSEERLRRFVADASHELRTPLASIRGYAELYQSGAAADQAGTEKAMDRIRLEAIRTSALVDDLLLLARLDEDAAPEREAVDLTRIVTDSVADARAIEPGRTITSELADRPITISGDEAQLRQVLANLLTNARVHAARTPVTVGLRLEDGIAIVEVTDAGPGMDIDEQQRIFDRFWRADTARTRGSGGTGLGLAITAAVVHAHHGSIVVDSAPGAGATFRVSLPLV